MQHFASVVVSNIEVVVDISLSCIFQNYYLLDFSHGFASSKWFGVVSCWRVKTLIVAITCSFF